MNCCNDVNEGSTDCPPLLRLRWSAARRSVESEMLLDIALEDKDGSTAAAAPSGTSWRDWGCEVGVCTGEGIACCLLPAPPPPPLLLICRWWKAPLCGCPLGGGAREKWCSTGTGLW